MGKYSYVLIVVTLIIFSCQQHADVVDGEAKGGVSDVSNLPDSVSFDSSAKAVTATVHSVPIPKTLYFAGEKVPLDRQDIRERLELELISNTYRHSRTLLVLKQAGRWKDTLQSLLEKNGVPADFFYLAIAESELNHSIKSPAGALGMWQFMKGTGKEYKLRIDAYVDQRRDPYLATVAACNYLKNGYEKFNSWSLVAASYNMGMAGLKKKMKDQKQDSYYDLYLYRETSRYVFRILAFKVILENPELYGFSITEEDKYDPWDFKEVWVKKSITNLVDWAIKNGSDYLQLRRYNPWFNNSSTYKLTVPRADSVMIRLPK